MTGSLREFLAARPDAVDCRPYLSQARTRMAETVERLIGVLRPVP
jgi:fructose-bisphosphate aldolase, class II